MEIARDAAGLKVRPADLSRPEHGGRRAGSRWQTLLQHRGQGPRRARIGRSTALPASFYASSRGFRHGLAASKSKAGGGDWLGLSTDMDPSDLLDHSPRSVGPQKRKASNAAFPAFPPGFRQVWPSHDALPGACLAVMSAKAGGGLKSTARLWQLGQEREPSFACLSAPAMRGRRSRVLAVPDQRPAGIDVRCRRYAPRRIGFGVDPSLLWRRPPTGDDDIS